MNTELVKITIEDSDEKFNKAVEFLQNEEVVGMPTETVSVWRAHLRGLDAGLLPAQVH